MPSRYEPCGLNQIYSLKYGTPPVVRKTGGLADTVVNATEENLLAGHGHRASRSRRTRPTPCTRRCGGRWTLYRDRPEDFRQVMRTAMAQDWSWDRSAEMYESLYRHVMAAGESGRAPLKASG